MSIWIELDGADNTRDLGGLPTADGRATRHGRLLRGDDLRRLTPRDVRRLVGGLGLRRVADLRSDAEAAAAGPGPLARVPGVRVRRHSLFPENGADTRPAERAIAELLPAQEDGVAVAHYLAYLYLRPDAFVAALRTLAYGPGAAIAHCTAGKDRTSVVVAFALETAGVTRDAIVADYLRTGERIDRVLARLGPDAPRAARQRPRADTLLRFLAVLDEHFGGPRGWLRAHGWSAGDDAALRDLLLA